MLTPLLILALDLVTPRTLPVSEQGQFGLEVPSFVVVDRAVGMGSPAAVLAGLPSCEIPTLQLSAEQVEEASAISAAHVEASCFEVTSDVDGSPPMLDCRVPGVQAIRWARRPACITPSHDALTLVDDRWELEVVAREDLRGELDYPFERAAAARFHPGPAGAFPDDWVPAAGEPMYTAQLGRQGVFGRLVSPSGATVAFLGGSGYMSSASVGWRPDAEPDRIPFEGGGTTEAFFVSDPSASIEDHLPVGTLIDASDIAPASVELVAVYRPPPPGDDRWGPPAAIRAVVRDAEGHLLFDMPTRWEVTLGRIALQRERGQAGEGMPESSLLGLADRCDAAVTAEPRTATIVATVGDAQAELALAWTSSPEHLSGQPAGPQTQCEGPGGLRSSGCRLGEPRNGPVAMLLGLVLAVVRRRRGRRGSPD